MSTKKRRPRRRTRRSRARGGRRGWGALVVLLGLAAAGYLGWRWLERPVARPSLDSPSSPGEALPVPPAEAPATLPVAEPGLESDPAATPGVGHLAIVIDDLGRSLEDLEVLARLGVPLSYSVLPYESRTAAVVAQLRSQNLEILCHLPMQPANGKNPGPGALVAGMSPRRLARATRDALARVPGAVGVNNHMGSELTEDRAAMQAILEVLRDEELFFLDSRTTADSTGYDLARSLEIPTAERQVFLDADPSADAIREQFSRLRGVAAERGAAIAIAHPHSTTLEVLAEEVPKAAAAGFDFVPVSFLLERISTF